MSLNVKGEKKIFVINYRFDHSDTKYYHHGTNWRNHQGKENQRGPRVLQGFFAPGHCHWLAQESMDKAVPEGAGTEDLKKKAERENKSREDIQLLLHSVPEEDNRLIKC